MGFITQDIFNANKGLGYNPSDTSLIQGATTAQADQAYQQQQNFINALQGQHGIQNQSDVYGQYAQMAAGQGANPAQAMLAQQTGANTANQAALMAGQRGAAQNVGMLARQAGMQGAANQQAAIGQGASMQAQQQQQALGQMAGIAGQQVSNLGGNINTSQQNLLNSISQQNQARVGLTQTQSEMEKARAGAAMGMVGAVTGPGGNAMGSLMQAHGGEIPTKDELKQRFAAGGAPVAPQQSSALYNGPTAMQPVAVTAPVGAMSASPSASYVNSYFENYNKPASADVSSASAAPAAYNPSNGAAAMSQGMASTGKGLMDFGKGLYKKLSAKGTPKVKGTTDDIQGGADSMKQPELGSQFAKSSYDLGVDKSGYALPEVPKASESLKLSGKGLSGAAEDVAEEGLADGGEVDGDSMPAPKPAPEAGGDVNSLGHPKSGGIGKMIPSLLAMLAYGGSPVVGEQLASQGKLVPGKAKVKGDSYANDTVDAKLSPGEVVIPRSVMNSKDPVNNAAKFVAAVLAKNGRRK